MTGPADRRHEYQERDFSPSFQSANICKQVNKVTFGRPPQVASAEIRNLLEKYPSTRTNSQLLAHNRESINDVWNRCNKILAAEPFKLDVQKHELQNILEDHRLDMHLQTAQILSEMDFADDVNLKRLYNYHLATNRNNYEQMVEAREEFVDMQSSPEFTKMMFKIAAATTIANRRKKQRDSKLK